LAVDGCDVGPSLGIDSAGVGEGEVGGTGLASGAIDGSAAAADCDGLGVGAGGSEAAVGVDVGLGVGFGVAFGVGEGVGHRAPGNAVGEAGALTG